MAPDPADPAAAAAEADEVAAAAAAANGILAWGVRVYNCSIGKEGAAEFVVAEGMDAEDGLDDPPPPIEGVTFCRGFACCCFCWKLLVANFCFWVVLLAAAAVVVLLLGFEAAAALAAAALTLLGR